MDYRLAEKPSFPVVGKALRVGTKDGENMRRIPQFWQECVRDGSHGRLTALASHGNVLGDVLLGICTDFAADMSEYTYMIAAAGQGIEVPEGMAGKTIPAATWAVFEANGPLPDSIQAVWGRIWSEFFPATQLKHADGPDLELYPTGDHTRPDYRCEVWVPIVTRAVNAAGEGAEQAAIS